METIVHRLCRVRLETELELTSTDVLHSAKRGDRPDRLRAGGAENLAKTSEDLLQRRGLPPVRRFLRPRLGYGGRKGRSTSRKTSPSLCTERRVARP